MPVHKRKYSSGKVVWYYLFDHPSSNKDKRVQVKASGFTSKQSATDAEAARRIAVAKEWEEEKAKATGTPVTLAHLLRDFFDQHGRELAPKTLERYREDAKKLSADILSMPLADITSLHLTREWNRLRECGGRTRTTGKPRPMSAKTVRNIAGIVSSAFARGRKWGVVDRNPVEGSDLPKWRKREGVALTVAQTTLLIEAATSPWCLGTFLQIANSIGARRGEVLALRWSDIDLDTQSAYICKSLCQTKDKLEIKETKTGDTRELTLPESALAILVEHRQRQEEFRRQFGPDYRSDLDLVFANEDGSWLRPDSISASVSALFKKLKLPKGASLHSLRHTHGSQLLADGMELTAVSKRLGHRNPSTTMRVYAHALDGRDKEAAKRWEEYQKRGKAQSGTDRSEKVQ